METKRAPKTLLQAVRYFSDPDVAHDFVAALRFPDGVITCPKCGGTRHSHLVARRVWKCLGCKRQFSVKVGTIFEDSPISLQKWLPAMWMLVNSKNGISSYELSRALGVTQKSAWFMLHRIRLAMQAKSFDKSGGPVEVDETFIGGKARNMHKLKRERVIKGTGGMNKSAVVGLLERKSEKGHSTVRTSVVKSTKKPVLHAKVLEHVLPGATVYTDDLASYDGLEAHYVHQVINHAEKYVDGQIHTNGLENFWSLLKRALKGTYISVEPFHLFRYLDEQCYRFNERKLDDQARFVLAAASIFGRRLTYKALTGQMEPETC
jgi:transposase-like protein